MPSFTFATSLLYYPMYKCLAPPSDNGVRTSKDHLLLVECLDLQKGGLKGNKYLREVKKGQLCFQQCMLITVLPLWSDGCILLITLTSKPHNDTNLHIFRLFHFTKTEHSSTIQEKYYNE